MLPATRPQCTSPLGCSSYQQQTEANALFATLKEHLADVVDEIVSINNRKKVNKVIKKFDDEALKAQRMMTQAQQVLLTTHRECIYVIHEALTANDIRQGVNNSVNMPPCPVEALVVNDNVKEGSNTVQKIPQQEDEFANMNDVQQQNNSANEPIHQQDVSLGNNEGHEVTMTA
jgi:hypothetical protein